MMLKNSKLAILILAISILLVGCSGTSLQQNKEITEARQVAATSIPSTPHQIVLMLPFKGQFASTSQAIRNGFLASYYYSRKQHPKITIKIVDTSGHSIQSVYQKVIASNPDVIVGPLTKQEVEAINNLKPLTIPIIALNTLDNYAASPTPHLYQFGLLPQDEAIQAADKMSGDNRQHAVIITQDNVWGQKIATAFVSKYQSLGGKVVGTMKYANREDIALQICSLVADDAEKMCFKKSQTSSKSRLNHQDQYAPKHRQDIDSIFLVATPTVARQIIPMLKYYYAGDLPVYSTSAIYSGFPQSSLDQDLNGALFCDMPWVIQNGATLPASFQTIRQQIATLWPDSLGSSSRLYALGIDAFNLAVSIHKLLGTPEQGIQGATGMLYLDQSNHVYRQLEWAQFLFGEPQRR